jgi:hypothetical protein
MCWVTRPSGVRVRMKLEWTILSIEQKFRECSTMYCNTRSKMPKMNVSWSTHKLIQNMECMSNIRPSNSEINKTSHYMAISRGILKRCTISGTQLQVKIHRCGSYVAISNARMSNQIMYISRLRDIISLGKV